MLKMWTTIRPSSSDRRTEHKSLKKTTVTCRSASCRSFHIPTMFSHFFTSPLMIYLMLFVFLRVFRSVACYHPKHPWRFFVYFLSTAEKCFFNVCSLKYYLHWQWENACFHRIPNGAIWKTLCTSTYLRKIRLWPGIKFVFRAKCVTQP